MTFPTNIKVKTDSTNYFELKQNTLKIHLTPEAQKMVASAARVGKFLAMVGLCIMYPLAGIVGGAIGVLFPRFTLGHQNDLASYWNRASFEKKAVGCLIALVFCPLTLTVATAEAGARLGTYLSKN